MVAHYMVLLILASSHLELLCCILEQDTKPAAYYYFKQGRLEHRLKIVEWDLKNKIKQIF